MLLQSRLIPLHANAVLIEDRFFSSVQLINIHSRPSQSLCERCTWQNEPRPFVSHPNSRHRDCQPRLPKTPIHSRTQIVCGIYNGHHFLSRRFKLPPPLSRDHFHVPFHYAAYLPQTVLFSPPPREADVQVVPNSTTSPNASS